VSARIGIKAKPPICPNDLGLKRALTGGLIVVGSYVPKTTKQVRVVIVMNITCIHTRAEGPNIYMHKRGRIYKEPFGEIQ
jgi:hypothetical protein